MSGIRAVIFDCYSTLVDIKTDESNPQIYRYLSLYLQYYGAQIEERTLKTMLKREKERYIRRKNERYPEVDLEVVFNNIVKKEGLNNPFLAESCCKLFRLLSRERFQLFPDSLPVLEEISRNGYAMAVVSDAQKAFCLQEGQMLGINDFFDHIILSTQYGFRKPDSRLFEIACSLLGIPPSEAVYIGDHPEKDVEGAKRIGMRVILVDRDSHKGEWNAQKQPDFYAKDLWEAWKWIRGNS
jgi:putative hydrolase of the HAD superfamily